MSKLFTTVLAATVSVMLITGCGGSGEVVDTQTPADQSQQTDTDGADKGATVAQATEKPVEKPVSKTGSEEVSAATAKAQAVSEEARAKLSELMRVHFDFDKAQITPSAAETLKANASTLKAVPGVKVTIEGHCDERGSTQYNLALGERRANAVKRFLSDTGVDPNRLNTVSKGEEMPLVSESSEDAWSKNRRAEFMVSK